METYTFKVYVIWSSLDAVDNLSYLEQFFSPFRRLKEEKESLALMLSLQIVVTTMLFYIANGIANEVACIRV